MGGEKVPDRAGWADAAKLGLCPELEWGAVKLYAARPHGSLGVLSPWRMGDARWQRACSLSTPCEKGGSACKIAAASHTCPGFVVALLEHFGIDHHLFSTMIDPKSADSQSKVFLQSRSGVLEENS